MGWAAIGGKASALSWLLLVGCAPSSGTFQCEDNGSCIANGVGGTCQEVGFCSFPDPTCESSQRYGELAGSGFAGECVPQGGGGTGGDGSGGATASGGTTSPRTTAGTSDTLPGTSMGAMTTPGTTNTSMTTSDVTTGVTTGMTTSDVTTGMTSLDTTSDDTVDPSAEESSTTDEEPIIAPPCADFNFGDAFGAGAMIPNVTVFDDNFGTECLPGAAPEVVFYWVAPVAGTYEFYADAPQSVDVVGGLWDACDGMEYVCDDDGGDVVDSRIVREVQPGDEFIWVVNVYGELENGISVSIGQTP